MFLQCSCCEKKHVCVLICNLYIEMSMEYLSLHLSIFPTLLRNVIQTTSASVLNLMSLCGKHSLQFSLNKMNSFLTQHQADPWVFFIKSSPLARVESEKCAVKANMCCFVLHEPVQSFAQCMSNTCKAFVSGPINEGGSGGRGGGWFYCLNICLLCGNLCATLPNCHMQ